MLFRSHGTEVQRVGHPGVQYTDDQQHPRYLPCEGQRGEILGHQQVGQENRRRGGELYDALFIGIHPSCPLFSRTTVV